MPLRQLPPLIAETIAIGSELLLGGRTDSNSQFVTDELSQLGIEVRFKSVVGDDRTDIVNVLKTAVGRAKVIVMTGGLGPTVDDCTREAIAQAAGRKLDAEWGVRSYREREVMRPWPGGETLPGWRPEIDLDLGVRGLLAQPAARMG